VKEAAEVLAAAEEANAVTHVHTTRFERAVTALSFVRVEVARNCLLRIADEGTRAVKVALTNALRQTETSEGRAVLVHLLSDDDVRTDAILAIGCAPWPEVLPALIEIAESDDHTARLSAKAIAKCGETAGAEARYAAADFLLEQLDDDTVLASAVDALMRFGTGFPGVVEKARWLAKEPGKRKAAGLCLAAACGVEESANLLELALSGAKTDESAARLFLSPLLKDADEKVRRAAERTWKALDLR
jgi:HEAT repeat protein